MLVASVFYLLVYIHEIINLRSGISVPPRIAVLPECRVKILSDTPHFLSLF